MIRAKHSCGMRICWLDVCRVGALLCFVIFAAQSWHQERLPRFDQYLQQCLRQHESGWIVGNTPTKL